MKLKEGIRYKPVPGFPEYLAGEDGSVWSIISGRKLRPCLGNNGYMKVTLKDEDGGQWTPSVHRIIAKAFCENDAPEVKTEINHINGDKTDNRAANLEWSSRNENLRHAYETGLRTNDVSAKSVIATNMETGEQMRFASIYKAARFLGISQGNICMCCKGFRANAGGYYWEYGGTNNE